MTKKNAVPLLWVFAAAAGLFFALVPTTLCADWPQFNGPGRDNISTETGLLKQWPEKGPEMLWCKPGFGEGYSSVSVSDGTMYCAGKVDADMVIFAMDLDGNRKWTATNGLAWSGSYPGTRCTPTVDGSRVYVLSGNGRLACLQATDGAELWAVDVKKDYAGKQGLWGYSESVLVDGDKVICMPGGTEAMVLALDKMTGKEKWKTQGLGHAAGYASAAVFPHGGKRIVAGMTGKAAVGVDAEDGRLLWQLKHENQHGINAQMPLFQDGSVFISSGWDCGSVLLKLSEDGTGISEIWRNQDLDNDFGGVVFLNGYFYGFNWVGNQFGELVCVDFKTGKTMVAKYTSDRKRKGAITWADGMLYGYDEGGEVWLGSADSTQFEVVSRFQLPEGSGPHWAHPVVSGGRLYIRHGDFLHAYSVKAE